MYVYIQIAIYWLDPPNTDKKQIGLQICGIGGGCRIAEVASHIISVNRSFSS